MISDELNLTHIIQSIEYIRDLLGQNPEIILEDRTKRDSVLRNLQTMAESCSRLSESSKSLRPDVSWREIASFRNVLVHDYLGLDMHAIVDVVKYDLPVLHAAAIELVKYQ